MNPEMRAAWPIERLWACARMLERAQVPFRIDAGHLAALAAIPARVSAAFPELVVAELGFLEHVDVLPKAGIVREERVSLTLGLTADANDAHEPTLWLLPTDDPETLRRLLLTAGESAWRRWEAASVSGCLLVRGRRRERGPIAWPGAEPYRAWLPHLFLPFGQRFRITPRRSTLTQLCPDDGRLFWLTPTCEMRSILTTAFRPLAERFTIARPQFVKRAAWDTELSLTVPTFAVLAVPTVVEPEAVPDANVGPSWMQRTWRRLTETLAVKPKPDVIMPLKTVLEEPLRVPGDRVSVLENRYRGADGRLSPSERATFWPDLAAAYSHQNRPLDAAGCWLNALWDAKVPSEVDAMAWLRAEAQAAHLPTTDLTLDVLLTGTVTPGRVRTLAAGVVRAVAAKQLLPKQAAIREYLDAHEEVLPLKAVWLTRRAIHGSDELALTRTRDRLFERLRRQGLSLEADVPAFYRFPAGDVAQRFQPARDWLRTTRPRVQAWIGGLGPGQSDLAAFGLQAEIFHTQAYADCLLAWGLAALGEHRESMFLLDQASERLTTGDRVHAALHALFVHRIAQARVGRTGERARPMSWETELGELATFERFVVDRLREHSRILEPIERFNAFRVAAYRDFRGWDDRKRALHHLPDLNEDDLRHTVARLLENAPSPGTLLDLLESADRLDGPLADRLFERLPTALVVLADKPTLARRLIDKALDAAIAREERERSREWMGHWVTMLADRRGGLPEGLSAERCVALKRLGLAPELRTLCNAFFRAALGGRGFGRLRRVQGASLANLLRTLLRIAAGWYVSGREEPAHRILEEARRELFSGTVNVADRTVIALAYVEAMRVVPVRPALGRLDELFQRGITPAVVGSSNTHYTLQPLRLLDTMIRAVVGDDCILGPAVRGWLDDDEARVRRRITDDLRATQPR